MKRKLFPAALLATLALEHSVPLWASDQTDQLPALRAKKTELEEQLTTLRAQDQEDAAVAQQVQVKESELQTVTTQIEAHELRARNATLEQAVVQQRNKDAEAAVKAAVKRGAIAPKDTELQAKWTKRCVEDPENIELLASIKGSPALDRSVTTQRLILTSGGVQVQREDSGAVLRAYARAKDHLTRATLYASEIRPRLKEGDDLPLRAADVTDTNLGTLAGTLVAQRALDLFKLEFDGILSTIATDFSDQTATFNSTENTRVVVVPAVENYDDTNGWVQGTPAKTVDVPITLDRLRGVPLEFKQTLLASTTRQLFQEQAPAASYALAKDVIDYLYAKITIANFADPAPFAESEINFGRRTFGRVARIFNPGGVPQTNRFALLNSDYFDALAQDPTLTQLATFRSPEIITAGELPPVRKFKPLEAPNLPATANLAAFFGHRSSLLVKVRVPNDYTAAVPAGASHGLVTTVMDPDTRLTWMLVWFVDHDKGKAKYRISIMYGTAKGNTKGGQIVTSQ
jgi:hypothetical protein